MSLLFLVDLMRFVRQHTGWARDDSGDVPGWVLITLMTAGIVTALWIVAEPKLAGILSNALNLSGDPNGK